MTDRLGIYNRALGYASEQPLASLGDDIFARRALNAVWNAGAVRRVLEQGLWNTALRSVELRFDTVVTPPFGRARAFAQPSDLVRTAAVCSDPYFRVPLTDYADESGYWYADLDVIYVTYVSDDPNFGGDVSRWPPSLTEAAARWLASVAAHSFNKSGAQIERMEAAARQAFSVARSRDAANQPTAFPPPGRWTSARRGSGGGGQWSRP